jgi:segregation and condensation protein A
LETPVFRLEGIVKTKDELSDFEGPLTLILQLLSRDKVEIKDISISLILEQYLAYLDEMAELDLDIASEFVAMASHLAYIKTKMLLSGDEEVSELQQLISSLEELQRGDMFAQLKEAAQTLAAMYVRGAALMPGPPEYLPEDPEGGYVHTCVDLLEAVLALIGRENALISSLNPQEAVYPRHITYPIPEKIEEIQVRLKHMGSMPLMTLFLGSSSRTELVATLVAILELCRVGSVLITGDGDELTITYMGAGEALELETDYGEMYNV